MPEVITAGSILLFAYLLGSIPWGLIIVKVLTGEDIRKIESGRTGGTNVGRAAGFWAGAGTAFLDGAKGTFPVWAAIWLLPELPIIHVLAGFFAVFGHNYSIFLIERTPNGIRLHGGAGGATTVGAAFGLWWGTIFLIVPFALFLLFIVGYASIATLSVGITSILIFSVRATLGLSPWEYILFGLLVELILIWALRPNIKRLVQGNERIVGLRAMRNKSRQKNQNDSSPAASS